MFNRMRKEKVSYRILFILLLVCSLGIMNVHIETFAVTIADLEVLLNPQVDDAEVTIIDEATHVETTAKTKDGVASFRNVDDAKPYTIKVGNVEGYEEYIEKNVVFGSKTSYDISLVKKTYIIEKVKTIGGQIHAPDTIAYNESYTATIIANDGYEISSIEVNGVQEHVVDKQQHVLEREHIAQEQKIDVTFMSLQTAFSFEYDKTGTLYADNDEATKVYSNAGSIEVVDNGNKKMLTFASVGNYHIGSIEIDGNEKIIAPSKATTLYTHEIEVDDVDHTVNVRFDMNRHAVQVVNSDGANIIITGDAYDDAQKDTLHGSSIQLTTSPKDGYVFEKLLINGVEVEPIHDEKTDTESYIIQSVEDDIEISASYLPIHDSANEKAYVYNDSQNGNGLVHREERQINNESFIIYNIKKNINVNFQQVDPTHKMKLYYTLADGSVYTTKGLTVDEVRIFNENHTNESVLIEKLVIGNTNVIAGSKIKLVFDDVNPVILGSQTDMVNGWKAGKVTIQVEAEDLDKEQVSSQIDRVVWNKAAALSPNEVLASTQLAKVEHGRYIFETLDEEHNQVPYYVYAIDRADNISEAHIVYVNIDKTAPTIQNFNIQGEAGLVVEELDYGYYFPQDVMVTITANDKQPSSGIQSITYYTVDYSQDKQQGIISSPTTVDVNDQNQITVNIPANFKGLIYAKAEDKVGNTTADFVHPQAIIIETQEQHEHEDHIQFYKKDTHLQDKNGKELYAEDVEVEFTIMDTFSGIARVEWLIESPYDTRNNQKGTLDIQNDGSFIEDANGGEWNVVQNERNLIIELKRTLYIRNNSNDIRVWVKMSDRAGNITTKELSFSIDKTKPVVEVTYDENDFDQEFAYETAYYRNNRMATIRVTERNFDPQLVNIHIQNTDGSIPTVSHWTVIEDQQNPDATIYEATIVYNQDGDYIFDMTVSDKAQHKADTFVPHTFTIDKTLPTIHVEFDYNHSVNGKYFAKDRLATITIQEHNFSPNRIKVVGNATHNGTVETLPLISEWKSDNDMHMATITFQKDADYTFRIVYEDKAGNLGVDMQPYEFTIDKTKPTIEISGVENNSANNGTVTPIVTLTDVNFDVQGISISVIGSNRGKINLPSSTQDIVNGQEIRFDDFENIQENDDLYTLIVQLEDKAGNTSEKSIQFSVNRFGSVYTFDSDLQAMNGKYVQQVPDIIITETNVDRLKKETIYLKLIKNGTTHDLAEGVDYTLSHVGGSGSWSQYHYKIDKSYFKDDGKYAIHVYSEDVAGNINENIDESKKAEISFGIDKTAPQITILDMEDGAVYVQEQKNVNVLIQDNLILESVRILVNDEVIEPIVERDMFTFPIYASNTTQTVRVVALDAAGNEEVREVKNFYVTTSMWIQLFYSPWFIYLCIILFISVLLGVSLLVRKRIKQNK